MYVRASENMSCPYKNVQYVLHCNLPSKYPSWYTFLVDTHTTPTPSQYLTLTVHNNYVRLSLTGTAPVRDTDLMCSSRYLSCKWAGLKPLKESLHLIRSVQYTQPVPQHIQYSKFSLIHHCFIRQTFNLSQFPSTNIMYKYQWITI